MNTKKHNHPVLLKLFGDLELRIPELKSGTYNPNDPTHYSRGFADFKIRHQTYQIHYNDITWGTEYQIALHGVTGRMIVIGEFYLSDGEVTVNLTKKGLFKILLGIVRKYPVVYEKTQQYADEYEEDPMGCISDYI